MNASTLQREAINTLPEDVWRTVDEEWLILAPTTEHGTSVGKKYITWAKVGLASSAVQQLALFGDRKAEFEALSEFMLECQLTINRGKSESYYRIKALCNAGKVRPGWGLRSYRFAVTFPRYPLASPWPKRTTPIDLSTLKPSVRKTILWLIENAGQTVFVIKAYGCGVYYFEGTNDYLPYSRALPI